MIRNVIDHDIVAIPVPSIAKGQVVRSHAKKKTADEEAARSASVEMPDMRRSKPCCEMPMVIGMIEMIVRVIRAAVVSNPMSVVVDVRSTGVAGAIAEVPVCFRVR